MDPLSLGFLALMVVLGGAIAYFGDWLGRKIGKKRLHTRRLRPKHFAALSTTVAGALIPLITILLVMAVSEDVRRWFFEGREAIALAQQRVEALSEMTAKLEATSKQVRGLEQRQRDAAADLRRAERDTAQLRREREELTQSRDRLAKERDQLQGRMASLQREIDALESRSERAEKDLAAREQRLAAVQREYDEVSTRLGEATRQLTDANRRSIELDMELRQRENEVAQKQQQVEALSTQLAGLETQLRTTESDLERAQLELGDTRTELEVQRLRVDQLRADAQALLMSLQSNLAVSRTSPLIISRGEELARVIVAPQAGMPEATSLLSRALQEASKRAKERGAKPARSGEVAELRNMQDVTAEQQAQRVISMVMGQSEQSVIIVYAFWNVFQDESVPVVANAYRNPLVYRAGQVITERRIDASRDEEDILRQVSAFISTDVRNKAIADKMIPAQGHEQSLGAVSPEMVFNLVADLKRLGRSVRLQALARNDTRAADPLQLDFRVR